MSESRAARLGIEEGDHPKDVLLEAQKRRHERENPGMRFSPVLQVKLDHYKELRRQGRADEIPTGRI